MKAIKDSKWTDVMWKILSFLALVFSIIAVCRSFCRTPDLEVDYMGVIVGVLAILVTVLVTWNIYSAIDANGKIKVFQKKIDDYTNSLNDKINNLQNNIDDHNKSIDLRMEEITKNVYHTRASIHVTATSFEEQIIDPRKDNISTLFIIDMLAVINLLSKSGNYEEANLRLLYYVDTIRSNLNTIKNGFNSGMRTKILKQLYEIPNKQKISDFDCLEKEILNVLNI